MACKLGQLLSVTRTKISINEKKSETVKPKRNQTREPGEDGNDDQVKDDTMMALAMAVAHDLTRPCRSSNAPPSCQALLCQIVQAVFPSSGLLRCRAVATENERGHCGGLRRRRPSTLAMTSASPRQTTSTSATQSDKSIWITSLFCN